MSIQNLLGYQECEKKKLQLLATVDGGKIRRELDDATKQVAISKRLVLELDADAKAIMTQIAAVEKSLAEATKAATDLAKMSTNIPEEQLQAEISNVSMLVGRISAYESQLTELVRKINEKTAQFEDAKLKIGRASKVVEKLTPEYKKQQKEIEPKIKAIDDELKTMEKGIDAKMLERYKKRRSSDRGAKSVDIVVPLNHERCGGCHFELPLSQIHNIAKDGYILCEECGKLIYK